MRVLFEEKRGAMPPKIADLDLSWEDAVGNLDHIGF